VTASTPRRQLAFLVLLALSLALALPAAAPAAEEGTTPTPTYTKESREAFEKQLEAHEIQSAEFNKKLRSLHIKTKDGTLYLYHYEKKGAPKLESQLKAKHVTYTILTPSAAAKEAKATKQTKHKIRYIVGGIVILLLVIGAIVFFVRRRNMRD
jgi:ATP-dependent Zn protease